MCSAPNSARRTVGGTTGIGSPRAGRDRQAGDGRAVVRSPRHGPGRRVAARAASVSRREVQPFLCPGRDADARLDRLLVAHPAAVRSVVGPAGSALAAADRRGRGRRGDRGGRRRAGVLARGRVRHACPGSASRRSTRRARSSRRTRAGAGGRAGCRSSRSAATSATRSARR